MEFIEYPKMLYKDDAHAIAADAEAERALRAEGWGDHDAQPDDGIEELLGAPGDPTEPAKATPRKVQRRPVVIEGSNAVQ